jgi:hypothetical protein
MMNESSNGSGRSALEHIISKITTSRRDAKILTSPAGFELVRASKEKIASELWKLMSAFNENGDELFTKREAKHQYSVFEGPYHLAVLLSLQDDTILVVRFRKGSEDSFKVPIKLETLEFKSSTTPSQEIVWIPEASEGRLNANDVVSEIAQKFAQHISNEHKSVIRLGRQYEGTRGKTNFWKLPDVSTI